MAKVQTLDAADMARATRIDALTQRIVSLDFASRRAEGLARHAAWRQAAALLRANGII